MRLFSFGGYGLALAALALVVFGAYDSYLSRPAAGYTLITARSGSVQSSDQGEPIANKTKCTEQAANRILE